MVFTENKRFIVTENKRFIVKAFLNDKTASPDILKDIEKVSLEGEVIVLLKKGEIAAVYHTRDYYIWVGEQE